MKGDQPEFDFENSLPPGKEFFSIGYLALLWNVSEQHVANLIDGGELDTTVDLRGARVKTRSLMRVPRLSVVAFLKRRKR